MNESELFHPLHRHHHWVSPKPQPGSCLQTPPPSTPLEPQVHEEQTPPELQREQMASALDVLTSRTPSVWINKTSDLSATFSGPPQSAFPAALRPVHTRSADQHCYPHFLSFLSGPSVPRGPSVRQPFVVQRDSSHLGIERQPKKRFRRSSAAEGNQWQPTQPRSAVYTSRAQVWYQRSASGGWTHSGKWAFFSVSNIRHPATLTFRVFELSLYTAGTTPITLQDRNLSIYKCSKAIGLPARPLSTVNEQQQGGLAGPILKDLPYCPKGCSAISRVKKCHI